MAGNDLADSATSWAMVRDNVTGLIWEAKQVKDGVAQYANPNDADNIYTWCDTDPNTNGGVSGTCGTYDTQGFLAALNSGAGYAGHTDWRLPTIKELRTLVDGAGSRMNPAISFTYFPDTVSSAYYLSSTTYNSDTLRAWGVYYGGGNGVYKSNNSYVRAVRGGQQPAGNRFVVSGDTVTDTVTCLEWQRATADTNGDGLPDTMNWQDALAYAEGLSLGGHTDWRLPDYNELSSIVDYSRINPSIDSTAFPDTVSNHYSSSTTRPASYDLAYVVSFGVGGDALGNKLGNIYNVRAVRNGQCGQLGYSVITAAVGSGGILDTSTPSPRTVGNGSAVQFTFNAGIDYHVAGVTGCGMSYNNADITVLSYTATIVDITNNCTVSATFALNQYSVSASAGAHGSLDAGTPSPQTVNYDATAQFIFNADADYHVASVTGCGISYTNTSNAVTSYTATTGAITVDCTASATFAINQHRVLASAGSNGSLDAVTPSPQTVNHAATAQFTFNADAGYHVSGISGCGVSYANTNNAVASYTATTEAIAGDCTVSATFAINQYTVSASAGANGTLDVGTPSPQSVNHGDTAQFTFNADTGYHMAEVAGCGVNYANTTNGVTSYTTTSEAITGDCTVSATFAIDRHQISVTTEGEGSVTSEPAGINCPGTCGGEYDYNTAVTLTAVPDEDAIFAGWSGECTGTETTCEVIVNRPVNATARFNHKFPWTMFLPAITTTLRP